jgi:methionyl-tRNA formyltransferase
MMRVVVITSLDQGIASLVLPELVQRHDVAALIKVSRIGKATATADWKRKLRKMRKVGVLGALNGVRIRNWFLNDAATLLKIENVEQVAARLGVTVLHVPYVNSPETQAHLERLKPDLAISMGNSFIAPRIFTIPKHGSINCHHEVLPEYKGAQSIIWQIHDGSRTTGYTVHKIDNTIDGGDILYQERLPIRFSSRLRDTVVNTMADLYRQSAVGVAKVIDNFTEMESRATRQGKGRSFTTPTAFEFMRIALNHRRAARSKDAVISK